MKKKIISGVILGVVVLGIAGGSWKVYHRYEPVEETMTVELGENLKTDPAVYINANKKALKATKVDLSKVDIMKQGKYPVTALCGDRKVEMTVEVKDTMKPEITLKKASDGFYEAVAGQQIESTAFVESVTDKAGVKMVSFDKGQADLDKANEDVLKRVGVKFDKPGTEEVTICAEDMNGNVAKQKVQIKIVEDYLAHAGGFEDMLVEQGQIIDWMSGITKDEKIAEIKADASSVDMNTAGEYTLKYIIKGDDGKTTIEKMVKVTVVTPIQAQTMADGGSKVHTSSGTKQKSASESSSSRNSSGSGSSKKSGGASGSRGSGKVSDDPAGTTYQGEKTGEGVIDNFNGNTYEEGTW